MFSLEQNGENLMISLEIDLEWFGMIWNDLEHIWKKGENLTFLWSNDIIRM